MYKPKKHLLAVVLTVAALVSIVIVLPNLGKKDVAATSNETPINSLSDTALATAEANKEAGNSTGENVAPSLVGLTNSAVDDESDGAGIEIDGVAIEAPDVIESTDNLSANQAMLDFRMMNPGVVSDNVTDDAVEYEVVSSPADWDAAQQHERLPPELLTEEQADVVDQSAVPVLLPPRQPLIEKGVFTIGDTWYAASMNEGEVNVLIEGSTASVVLPNQDQTSNIGTLASYQVTRSFGMAEVNVSEFGVVYTVTVECFDHENDPACVDDQFITELVDNLLLAKGDIKDDGA